MAAPTGLYEQVQANHRRSLLLFAMFAVAFQLLAAVTLFLPLLLFDPAHAPGFETVAYLRRYVPLVLLLSVVLFAAQYWWFVGSVRRQTGFRYIDSNDEPRLCRLLEPLAIGAGIATPYAGVIESPAMNAFACGVRNSHMVVVATRGLIDGLDDDELAAALANAVIHIRNRDTRLLASASIFMRNMTVLQKERGLKLDHPVQILPLVVFPVLVPVILVLGFLIQLAFRIAYGSRALIGMSRELIADAEAVRLTHNPAALLSALRQIHEQRGDGDFGEPLDAMLIVGVTAGPLATHPTLEERAGALARTTGSMVLDTAQRLDTRPPEKRRRHGFGRKPDPALERIAALAAEPERRGFWGAFRSVRDPDRNIVGLNRRGIAILFVSLIGIALLYRQTLAQPRPMQRLFAMEGITQMAGLGTIMASCTFGGLNASAGEREHCEKQAVEAGRMFEHIPGFATVDGKPREYLTFREQAARDDAAQIVRGCFPGRWGGMKHGRAYNQELSTYLRFASEGAARVNEIPPGPKRDKALINYAQVRVLIIDNSLHFFGEPGLSGFNAAISTPANDALLDELEARMQARDFAATLDRRDTVSFTLLARIGTALRPCWGKARIS